MKVVSIIRDRGQLTIPESIRKSVPWVNPMSAVTIFVTKANEIVIKPHRPTTDWSDLREKIRASRATLGRGTTSAAQTLEQDRSSH
jgi:bifunctional DNA-binding transcriptional regulator/antitoxin component of YhaV-PrlF toxin-antitoxin module